MRDMPTKRADICLWVIVLASVIAQRCDGKAYVKGVVALAYCILGLACINWRHFMGCENDRLAVRMTEWDYIVTLDTG